MKKSNKNLPRVYQVVKAQGRGAVKMLSETLWKKESNVSQTLRKGSMSFNNSHDYTLAINSTFWTNYSREELFNIP